MAERREYQGQCDRAKYARGYVREVEQGVCAEASLETEQGQQMQYERKDSNDEPRP